MCIHCEEVAEEVRVIAAYVTCRKDSPAEIFEAPGHFL